MPSAMADEIEKCLRFKEHNEERPAGGAEGRRGILEGGEQQEEDAFKPGVMQKQVVVIHTMKRRYVVRV